MIELFEALILGIVQGLTEFLPVSSSGHLEIMKYLLNDDSLAEQSMMTTVFLHFATALATMVIFRKDIIQILKGLFVPEPDQESRRFAMYIIISMVPAVIIGLGFEDLIESFFYKNIVLVSFMLLVTGALLLISEKIQSQQRQLDAKRALIVGISQAIAILPGISRSGATIATSLILGIDKSAAARFSFLMVIPLIFGKMAKDILSGDLLQNIESISYLIVGFLSAFITGLIACQLMLHIVKKSKMSWFAYYCFVVGLSLIAYNTFV